MPKRKRNRKEKDLAKTALEVMKIRCYDEEAKAFILSGGIYMDFFEITARDRQNLQDDAVQFDIYQLSRFEKLYAPDHKDVAMNFPINTGKERRYLERKKKQTIDPVRRLWLDREIEELSLLDSNIERKEFYRFCYAASRDELEKNRGNLLSWLGSGRSRLVSEISKEKKIQVLKKLCNQCALIIEDELEEDGYEA